MLPVWMLGPEEPPPSRGRGEAPSAPTQRLPQRSWVLGLQTQEDGALAPSWGRPSGELGQCAVRGMASRPPNLGLA